MLVMTRGIAGKVRLLVAAVSVVSLGAIPDALAQNRLPASDDPGRIERRFPSPADMLRGETPTDMSTPPGSGNHPAPNVRKDNTPQIIQDGNDIILLPSGKEDKKK
ncbi:hypothetical protein [Paramagnetospirillum caucaseum]|uniref:hypothetical protein n=1 Tax=Paramagnetospirillum caucaseum TaxID=1244869 RepID=UPI001267F873|nr:hypothetical protein [Paramagnetospirillum caucaseum]